MKKRANHYGSNLDVLPPPNPLPPRPKNVKDLFVFVFESSKGWVAGLPPEEGTVVKCSSGSVTRRTEPHEEKQTQ
jgi:hypothetical protein